MGRYPEAEDRASPSTADPESNVMEGRDTGIDHATPNEGGEGAGARNAPIEGQRQE